MYRYGSRKGQGAIEFAIMFSVVMFFFLALFIFLSNEFGNVDRSTRITQSLTVGQSLYDELVVAQGAPVGFRTEIDLNLLDPVAGVTLSFNNDAANLTREIVITESSGNSHLFFLPESVVVSADVCEGRNEIYRAPDGVGLCCLEGGATGCEGKLPTQNLSFPIHCKGTRTIGEENISFPYYNGCDDFKRGDTIDSVRGECVGTQMSVVYMRLIGQTAIQERTLAKSEGKYNLGPLGFNLSGTRQGTPIHVFALCFQQTSDAISPSFSFNQIHPPSVTTGVWTELYRQEAMWCLDEACYCHNDLTGECPLSGWNSLGHPPTPP